MHPLNSNRLAWAVAAAALGLWATSAQATLGQAAAGPAHLFQTATDMTTSTTIDTQADDGTALQPAPAAGSEQCAPVATPAPALVEPSPSVDPSTGAATFHICGADTGIEHAIEQLIAGRGFNASLRAGGDSCADLTIRPSGSPVGSGSTSTNLSVSTGSGHTLTLRIESAQGATRAAIGG